MKYPKKISHVESTQSYIVKRRRSKLGCHSAMFDDITSHPTVRKSMSHRYHIGSQQKGTKK